MIPTTEPNILWELTVAGELLDCQLELALMRAGIIARVDLDRVRALLRHTNVRIDAARGDRGSRELWFFCEGTLLGVLDVRGEFRHFTVIPGGLGQPIYSVSSAAS